MFLLGSAWRGLRAMRRHAPVRWVIAWGRWGFWYELWTPTWREGREPCVSIGLGFVRIDCWH